MFIDRAKIHVQGGDGGNGVTAFRREKFVPRGGPSGGDGGRGGDVVLVADASLNTLLHLRYNPQHVADRGSHGEGSNRSGHSGADLMVRVPVGTQIFDASTGDLLHDLSHDGDRWLAARGGRGGFGNAHFTTSTNRAPRYHQTGSKGEELDLQLELKLLADVGLVGFPNAGKSTFISPLSAARPKIADYPFPTLEPHLGVVDLGDFRTFVIADIPGLIEGAHTGAGLGDRFLRHIERTRLLVHLVAPRDEEPRADAESALYSYDLVNNELHSYSDALARKPQIICLTKTDLLEPEEQQSILDAFGRRSLTIVPICAHTASGLTDLISLIFDELR